AKEIQVADLPGPLGIIDQSRGIGFRIEVEEAAQLFLHPGNVGGDCILAQQLALGALSAGIADGPRRPARHGAGMMAGELEAAQANVGQPEGGWCLAAARGTGPGARKCSETNCACRAAAEWDPPRSERNGARPCAKHLPQRSGKLHRAAAGSASTAAVQRCLKVQSLMFKV